MVTEANYQTEQRCRWLNHIMFDQTDSYAPAVGMNIRNYARSAGAGMPNVALQEGILLASQANYLLIERLVNPVSLGVPQDPPGKWADSHWHKDLISQDPKRMSIIDALRRELDEYFPSIRSASYM